MLRPTIFIGVISLAFLLTSNLLLNASDSVYGHLQLLIMMLGALWTFGLAVAALHCVISKSIPPREPCKNVFSFVNFNSILFSVVYFLVAAWTRLTS